MQSFSGFARLVGWVGAFVALVATTGNATASVVVVMLLMYREDISSALRRRRVVVEVPGFKGSIDGGAGDPPDPGRA